jgi:hypothetical protein
MHITIYQPHFIFGFIGIFETLFQVLADGVTHRSCVPEVGRIAPGCVVSSFSASASSAASKMSVCYCKDGDSCNGAENVGVGRDSPNI